MRAIALMFLLTAASSAWADSLVVMSGAGQSGLGGSTAARPIVVQARNVDGAVVAGRTITWTTSNGFVLSAPSSTTDADGLASVSFTYGNYGTTNIVASDAVGATTASASQTSTGSDSITVITGNNQVGRAYTTATQPIVVQVLDASGHPVVGRAVSWADQTAYSQVQAASSVTDSIGQASMGFRYLQGPPALGGAVATIRATDPVGPVFADATEISLGLASVSVVSPESLSGIYGGTSGPLVVQVLNTDGSPVVGATVTWADRYGTGLVIPSSPSTVTDATGRTSITVQFVDAGTGDVEATYGVSQTDIPYSITRAGAVVVLSPKPMSGTANTVSTTPMIIRSYDRNGQPAAGHTINWTNLDGDAFPLAATSVADSTGTASMNFNFGNSGGTICAEDAITLISHCNSMYLVPLESIRLVSGDGQIGPANTPGAQPIVVEVLDGNGNPVSGRVLDWSFNFSEGTTPSLLAAPSITTDASGRAQMTFTYGTTGRTEWTVSNPQVGSFFRIRVTAVGMDTFMVISGDRQSGLINTHSTQPLVAELRDNAGNPIVGATVTWGTNHGACPLDNPTGTTDTSGRVSTGFTYGPTADYCAWEADDPTSRARAEFNATAVGANAISLVSGNGQTGVVDGVGALPLVVEVRDASGNPVAGRTITWTNVAGLTSALSTSSVTDAGGRASMNFIYGPNPAAATIVATDSATGQQVRFTLTSTRPAGSGTIVSGNGQSGLPGTAGAQPIVIELRDAGGTPIPGATVVWSVVSGPATLGVVNNATDASGRASAAFSFGATAGTSVIQASGLGGQLLQAAVTALGNNQALSVVSGDAQTLVANTTSEPLVVLLKNFANVPVAGATINWTTSSGTLASATTITDAAGRASNSVTTTVAGAVTVQATSTLAAAPVTFTLNTGLATLPNLTPEQQSVAVVLDNACPALAELSTLSPQQADLLARCQEIAAAAGINGGATATALEELLSDSAQVQSATAAVAISAQVQNVNSRLVTLRSGSGSPASNGLTFTGPGGMIQLGSLMSALSGDVDKPKDPAGFSRWGFFATGNIGRGEADATRASPAYDYDINGITVGVDYRQRDNMVLGAALGYSRQDTDLDDSQGSVAMSGWSVSGYSTYSFKELWYLDGVLTFGRNQFELTRRIAYTLPTPGGGSTSINQVATGRPDGDLFSAALTFGGDFHKDAWAFSPYGQVVYSRMGFDAYEESLRAGPGSGLGLAVESRDITALTGILGARVMLNHSADWGVFTPTASLEWNHEFKDDPEAISARLIYDPTHTLFNISGERMDSDYLRLGIGMSLVLTRGRSGFFLFQHMVARDGQSQDDLSLGIRVEF